jgi:hypothetical protein
MEKAMGRRAWALLIGIIVSFLLLTAGGCAAKREALHPDGASSLVQTRVPPAEAIGIQWERDGNPAPPIPLPLSETDKAGARTPAAPGVGWLMLIEVNFYVSPPSRDPTEREESVEAP